MVSLPPPLTQCCLEGLGFHQGNLGGKATLIRGRGGKIYCGISGFHGQSSHSFQSVSTVLSEIGESQRQYMPRPCLNFVYEVTVVAIVSDRIENPEVRMLFIISTYM